MATFWTFITFVFIAISCYSCEASAYPVPLLIWSTKSVDVDDEILAGHTLNYEDVQVKYLDKLKTQSKLICLFVQDKLSIDDFAAHQSKHFRHLKEVLYTSPTSIVLPSVSLKLDSDRAESNNRLVEYLEKNSFGTVLPFSYEDVADFSNRIKLLKADDPTIIIVHLPEAKNEADSLRNLESSDEVIGKISDVLSSRFPDYVGLLTADMPRDDVRTGMADARQLSVTHVRDRRSSQDPENDDGGNSIPCNQSGVWVAKRNSMIYITNLYLLGDDKNNTDTFRTTTNVILPKAEIKVENISSSVKLTFPLKGVFQNDSDIAMSFLFNRTKIRWWCVTIKIDGKIQESDFSATFDCRKIDVPFDKSFACQVNLNFSGEGEMNKSRLVFQGLQLQPYDVKDRTFANAYDCIPFFTPAIWMGLISVAVLVAILYGGMLALLSIKSMDRFDNPKDPQIIIHSE